MKIKWAKASDTLYFGRLKPNLSITLELIETESNRMWYWSLNMGRGAHKSVLLDITGFNYKATMVTQAKKLVARELQNLFRLLSVVIVENLE